MSFSISSSYATLRSIIDATSDETLPSLAAVAAAEASLSTCLPGDGLGEAATEAHLLHDLTPGFNGPKTSANFYGFVTGGVFPIAEVADHIVTAYDQNVQVHLPDQTICTTVEDRALSMLLELLDLDVHQWKGRTFTTGATGANLLGLACGRESIVNARLRNLGRGRHADGVGKFGLLGACLAAGVQAIQVLTTMGHSSLYKAASIVGLGRGCVKDIPVSKEQPWRLDIEQLETELKKSGDGILSIVAISAGEVNTGNFAVNGVEEMKKVRSLCDQYGAWLHVDGAFGIFARSLPKTSEFSSLVTTASGLELADSIAGDCHKMLNVPYDCGFFLTRSSSILPATFQNPNAAYLASGPTKIPSPLNNGLENSRRFRALPVYAALLAYGRSGYAEIFARQVRLARGISKFLQESEEYELLPNGEKEGFHGVHIIVIFRARDEKINEELVGRINGTRKMYVSGTKWDGKSASRIAISTWKVDVERDLKLISGILHELVR